MIISDFPEIKKIDSDGEDFEEQGHLQEYMMDGKLYSRTVKHCSSASYFFEQKPSLWKKVFHNLCIQVDSAIDVPKTQEKRLFSILVTSILTQVDLRIKKLCKEKCISYQEYVKETIQEPKKIENIIAQDTIYQDVYRLFTRKIKRSDEQDRDFKVFTKYLSELEDYLSIAEEAYSNLKLLPDSSQQGYGAILLENAHSAGIVFELIQSNQLLQDSKRTHLKERIKKCKDYLEEARSVTLCNLYLAIQNVREEESLDNAENKRKLKELLRSFRSLSLNTAYTKSFKKNYLAEWNCLINLCNEYGVE